MPKPIRFIYTKKEAFRDAYYLIIICEGQNREPDYFRFFDGMSSRVKVVPVPCVDGASAPMNLVKVAEEKERELDADRNTDQIWFIVDTDAWVQQIRQLRILCNQKSHWQIAQSNPCFEVWLYFHAYKHLPELEYLDRCNNWKPHVGAAIRGGFNCELHPIAIEIATDNAKKNYKEQGDTPLPGSTEVWKLAENLLKVINKDLQILKSRFPRPEAVL